MSLVVNGERCLVTLPRKESPEDFTKALKSRRGNDIKDYLTATRTKLGKVETEMMLNDIPLTAPLLRDYFRSGGVLKYTINDLFEDYFTILKKRIGQNLTEKTFRKYELATDRLLKMVDGHKPLSALTNALMKNYLAELNKDFDHVTAQGYGQKIKTVCSFAISNGKMKVDPFVDIKLRKGEKSVQYLEEEDVELIWNPRIENPSINRIRDLFLFQLNSGLAYCDLAALEPEDIQCNDEGQYYIHKQRLKTKTYFTSVIFPEGVEILKKYDFRLPLVSNQKYNLYLKTLRDICGVQKPLHTHVARHTFATMCLNKGVRLEVVAKLLGHQTEKMVKHYAKFAKQTIISEVHNAFAVQTQELARMSRAEKDK